MTKHQETAIAKLRQLPEPLAKLVLDFIDFLLAIPANQPNPTNTIASHGPSQAMPEPRTPWHLTVAVAILPLPPQ